MMFVAMDKGGFSCARIFGFLLESKRGAALQYAARSTALQATCIVTLRGTPQQAQKRGTTAQPDAAARVMKQLIV